MPRFLVAVLAAVLIVTAFPVHADTAPRTIRWEELAPKSRPESNPFAHLSAEQLGALAEVADVRDRLSAGDKTVTAAERAAADAASRRLKQGGQDVESLLATRREMLERWKSQGAQINARLDGQVVKLPGYLLPLELSGKRVTEFLLVPWVGACVHTPPPPPNQIVHVRTGTAVEMKNLFEPVWVTGRLTASATRQSLFLVDGASDIDVGYGMQDAKVAPYKP